jgi:hypothetical protein
MTFNKDEDEKKNKKGDVKHIEKNQFPNGN